MPGSGSARPLRKLPPGPGLPAAEVAAHQLARIHEAMIEIVAERGFDALKVREIVDHAEVSTRAFYEFFASKEDCFLQTYDLISRRAIQRLIAAQAEERELRQRICLVLEEFVRGVERAPGPARVALIEANAAGEASLRRAWRAWRVLENMLAECFARAPGGVAVPPLVVEGVVAGIVSVSKSRLLERVAELRDSREELIEWILCHLDAATIELVDLDRRSVWRNTMLEPFDRSPLDEDSGSWPSRGSRANILAAVAELATEGGFRRLTAPRIRTAASVSRQEFDAYFENCEDCYLAAVEQRVGEALAHASRARSAAKGPDGGIYRAIAAFCEHIAGDRFLARVCLIDDFPASVKGTRARRRLIATVLDFFVESQSGADRASPIATEASIGAVWELFHHHVVRDWSQRRQISATLAFFALAPIAGGRAALTAIEAEQDG